MEIENHLTILYPEKQQIFMKEDFYPEFGNKQISMIPAIEIQPFDGNNTAKVPNKTTHLIMHFLDRLAEIDLKQMPNLCYVGTCSTGWWDKYFDLVYMKRKNIRLDINATYAQNAVAEGIFAALLSYARRTSDFITKAWDAEVTHGFELLGKTLGIVGMGNIGTRVKEIANGFQMKVLYAGKKETDGIKKVTSENLISNSDIISLHIPKSANVYLTKGNFHLLKPTVTIINSSGFELIDIQALKKFLMNNPRAKYIHLAMPEKKIYNTLCQFPNALLYPLFTCYTKEADLNRKLIPINNLKIFLKGEITSNRII